MPRAPLSRTLTGTSCPRSGSAAAAARLGSAPALQDGQEGVQSGVKSLGRLRGEMDHFVARWEEGLSESGRRRGPRRGFRALPLAVRVYLVQSAAKRNMKLQGLRVRERAGTRVIENGMS